MYEKGIETFLSIVNTESLTQAADALFITQSTASKRLKKLEAELGFRLLYRGKGVKTVQLTEKGEQFLHLARNWHLLRQRMETFNEPDPGRHIHIAVSELFNFAWMRRLIPALLDKHPRLTPAFITAQSSDMHRKVAARQVDLAISLENRPNAEVAATPCYSEPWVLLRMDDGKPEGRAVLSVTGLDPEQEIQLNFNSPEHLAWRNHWISPAKSLYADNIHMVLNLFHSLRQWCLVPLSAGILAGQQGYAAYGIAESPPPLTYYRLVHRDPLESRKKIIMLFIEIMERSLWKAGGGALLAPDDASS